MADQLNYSELKAELDQIIDKMSQPSIDIGEAAKGYERGLKIISQLEKQLKQAQNKVKRLELNRQA